MHTKVVYQSAKALADIGCAVLRFNFRGVGRSDGAWDEGRGEMDDYRKAVDYMAAAHPGLELWRGADADLEPLVEANREALLLH